MTIAANFDSQYEVQPDGCWKWLRSRKGKEAKKGGGYGCFRLHGKTVGAHRFSYERTHGPIPAGLHVMHLCHNTLCVNPAHLATGTNAENLAHSARDLRRPSKLTLDQVRDIKRMVSAGAMQREAAAKHGLAQGDVSHIVNGHYWSHVIP